MGGAASPSVARGFLFADLRGYSAFVERHGDRTGADLLILYRDLVRSVLGDFDGAEIRTEGDSFYLAFGSPSEAVRCGLAILEAARDTRTPVAGTPIAVGIGVHAGETVELDEGYVGSAVNVAARVCAMAPAGQLLVTDAVRAMTRTYLDVAFISAGRRRLKGISEPMLLYRVLERGDVSAGQRSVVAAARRVGPLAGGAAVVLVVVVAVVLGSALLGDRAGGSAGLPIRTATPGEPAAGAPASAEPGEASFPSAQEAQLLAYVSRDARESCERATFDDRPRFRDYRGLAPSQMSTAPMTAISVSAGVKCSFSSVIAPRQLEYWQVGQVPDGPAGSSGVLLTKAGEVGATPGSCVEGGPRHERWSVGDRRGELLCYVTRHGDAIIYWTYERTDVLGRAMRPDGDLAALVRWWTTEARLAPGR